MKEIWFETDWHLYQRRFHISQICSPFLTLHLTATYLWNRFSRDKLPNGCSDGIYTLDQLGENNTFLEVCSLDLPFTLCFLWIVFRSEPFDGSFFNCTEVSKYFSSETYTSMCDQTKQKCLGIQTKALNYVLLIDFAFGMLNSMLKRWLRQWCSDMPERFKW